MSEPRRPLRVLMIEDVEEDARLVLRQLARGGFDVVHRRVQTGPELEAALREEPWDIAISDHALPGFGSAAALAALEEAGRDLPFIVVSGTIGEQVAVELMRAGASDYVMKDNLARLPSAVSRELRDAASRRARAEAEAALERSEAQLRQAQKMEAVGRLAGGIAHDFNNVLMAITGYSELALRRLTPPDPLREDVEEILKAAHRAATLTRQLLAFSRRQVLHPRVVALNAIVQDMERILKRVIGEDVSLEATLAQDLGCIRADPGQLEQIVMNLAVNARDAMPHGGSLRIRTANVELDASASRAFPNGHPGRFVELVFQDSGEGMTDEVKTHLFEPFFTTKEAGKGTGLGLSTVYGIVQQSEGSISVESAPGKGATFRIVFPRVDQAAEVQETPAGGLPRRGTGTVLLVEDEPGPRRLIRRLLESSGYQVLEAGDAEEALALAARPGPIEAVLADLVLPGMGGRALVARLLRAREGLKVVLMSGYTDTSLLDLSALGTGVAYLQKPFTMEALVAKLRATPAMARDVTA